MRDDCAVLGFVIFDFMYTDCHLWGVRFCRAQLFGGRVWVFGVSVRYRAVLRFGVGLIRQTARKEQNAFFLLRDAGDRGVAHHTYSVQSFVV